MNRRHFLIGSAGALGTLSAARISGASPNDTIRVACVGLRSRGKAHLGGYPKLPNVQIAAICDIDDAVLASAAKDLAAKGLPEAKQYKDLRKLLEDKTIDVVSIATPNHHHTLQTIWSVQAGKDVYVEKPCSHNMFEAKQIVAAARKHDRIVQQGSQARSSEALQEAVKRMRDGELGDIYMARGLCFKRRDTIGRTPAEPVPHGVDYDIWTGPAPLTTNGSTRASARQMSQATTSSAADAGRRTSRAAPNPPSTESASRPTIQNRDGARTPSKPGTTSYSTR